MRLLRILRDHPIVLLAGLGLVFVGWVVSEQTGRRDQFINPGLESSDEPPPARAMRIPPPPPSSRPE